MDLLSAGQKARILDQGYEICRTYQWISLTTPLDRGFAGGGRNRPTVTSPKVRDTLQDMNIKLTGSQEYKSRFREAMNRYILQGNLTPSIYAKLSKTVLQLPTAGINGSRSSRSRQRRLKARQWRIKLDLNNRRIPGRPWSRWNRAPSFPVYTIPLTYESRGQRSQSL